MWVGMLADTWVDTWADNQVHKEQGQEQEREQRAYKLKVGANVYLQADRVAGQVPSNTPPEDRS